MVSREFAPLLDGVSYVDPFVVDLDNSELHRAVALATKEFPHVLVTQIWGKDWEQARLSQSYNRESWRMAGFDRYFDNFSMIPLFDRRDHAREQAIWNKLNPSKPVILANLTHSFSSPFAGGDRLLEIIRNEFGNEFDVVDLSKFKFHRIYDALGMMDRARALITIDTAHLHLAPASGIPTVALVNQAHWLGSIPRFQVQARIKYDDATRNPRLVIRALRSCSGGKRSPPPVIKPVIECSYRPKIIHCAETHGKNELEPRKQQAQASWQVLYKAGVIPAHLDESVYPRSAQAIGDIRNLPFLKDVLALGLKAAAAPEDIIFLTNDDNYLHRGLPEYLRIHVGLYDCCCSHRCEFRRAKLPQDDAAPWMFCAMSDVPHIGRDLFAFSKAWLDRHWTEMPDFILGASEWDYCLAAMIRLHFGLRTDRKSIERAEFPADIERGYVSHVSHMPFWASSNNLDSAPSQRHNRLLFRNWSRQHAPKMRFDAKNCFVP